MSERSDRHVRVLLGTRNAGKLREFAGLLAPYALDLLDLDQAGVPRTLEEDRVEIHETFEANALAKAQYYHRVSGGLPTIADDSGLSVRALGGAPGVHSRRWAGATGTDREVDSANNKHLLARLAGTRARDAAFACALAFVDERRIVVVLGEVHGRIAECPRGDHGFGYDPVFEPDELAGLTFGEAGGAAKARISHRARAAAALARAVRGASDSGQS